MKYIKKTFSEPNVANKLSNQLKDDLSLLSQLYNELYQKDEMERINALNETYANYIKGYK